MANWLRDSQASQAAGRNIFRLPYPGGNWRDEKINNNHLLTLMDMAWRTAIVGFKSIEGEKLSDKENELIDLIAEHL